MDTPSLIIAIGTGVLPGMSRVCCLERKRPIDRPEADYELGVDIGSVVVSNTLSSQTAWKCSDILCHSLSSQSLVFLYMCYELSILQ